MTTPLVPFSSAPMTSIETYMYGLKKRAHEHHCLVHGTFPVEMEKLAALRKVYSKQVRPVTLLPFFIKAIALSVKENPGVNRILFRRFPWGRRIVSFNVVDVNVPITRKIGDEMVQFIGTIRGADALTVGQIQDAIEAMQRGNPLESPYIQKVIKLKSSPPFVAKLFHWLMTWSPKFYLKNAGTCSITTLDGMRGDHFFSVGPTTSLFCILSCAAPASTGAPGASCGPDAPTWTRWWPWDPRRRSDTACGPSSRADRGTSISWSPPRSSP